MKEKIKDFLVSLISRGYSRNTIRGYEFDLNEFYKLGGNPDINDYIIKLKDKGNNTITIKRKLCSVRGLYRFLKKEFNHEIKIKIEEKISSYLEPEEFKKILGVTESQRDKLIFETLFYTGIRIGELKSFVENFLKKKVKIIGKGNKERYVYLPGFLYKKLLKEKNKNGILFKNKNGSLLSTRYIDKIIATVAHKAGIQKQVSAHTFRHSFATYFLNNGGSLKALQEILGHKSIATTQIYMHLATKKLENEYNKTIKEV